MDVDDLLMTIGYLDGMEKTSRNHKK